MDFAIHRRLLQQNGNPLIDLILFIHLLIQVFVCGHKRFHSRFTFISLQLHIGLAHRHYVRTFDTLGLGWRDDGDVKANPDSALCHRQCRVRTDTNGAPNNLIVASRSPVWLHDVDMANIG